MRDPFDIHARRQYAGRAEAYRRTFGQLCAHTASWLLDAVGVQAGAWVCDVGTGPGTVAQLAVERGARVVALDAEPSMATMARQYVPTVLAALPGLPFADGSFDATVANFVINHVGDPAAGVAELARITRPDGRVAVTTWPRDSVTSALWLRAADAAGAPRPDSSVRLRPELDFDRTVEGLEGLLLRAGLADVSAKAVEFVHRPYPADLWSGAESGLGGVAGQLLASQTPPLRAAIRREFDLLVAPLVGADGRAELPASALLAVGRPGRLAQG